MRKRGIIAGAVGATLVAGAALRGMMRRFAIVEASMVPALEPGDWVLARRRTGSPERGDIVVYDDPAATNRHFVKRVVGLAGERIGVDGGRVTVNGAVLADRWAQGLTEPDGEWTIPEGHVWVLGDNRPLSTSDSRTVGPIGVDDIDWIVVSRYWPTSRVGAVD
ncbi:MAG: signal peptidase I [Acidimicrobiia bacterium]|nr:signal peptidase I [Acidimicrobiia bacterium]